jgi:hypothetical protein
VNINRRTFLAATAAITSCSAVFQMLAQTNDAPRVVPHPDPATFQSGDFVWPKRPGAYVPYHAGSTNSPEEDRARWARERDDFLQRESGKPGLTALDRERIEALRKMDYREFIAIYEGAQRPGQPGVYSGGSVYVGHVAIIEVDANKEPWVIEALVQNGVVRHRYNDWITKRADEAVWLGRLKDLDASKRASIVPKATEQIGKPYNFWNFDLNDDQGFYCSKLAWMSIYRALNFGVDGNNDPKRLLWFSPKQFLYTPAIVRLHDPGPYAL